MQALEVQQLTVNYGKTPVLWDLTFAVPTGRLVGIFGPNGAGKSTFLKAVLGIVKPLSGSVRFFEEPYRQARGRIAYIPQKESVDWDFPIRVIDVVLMGRYGQRGLFRWMRRVDRLAAMEVLERVGMGVYAHRQISQLSGGQQQRVFIARALLQEADLYLMDEPFAGVDMATEQAIVEIMQTLREEGKTIFVVQHDLKTAQEYFDWIIFLNLRLVASGELAEVFVPEMIERTYGRENLLLNEAYKLSQDRTSGLA